MTSELTTAELEGTTTGVTVHVRDATEVDVTVDVENSRLAEFLIELIKSALGKKE